MGPCVRTGCVIALFGTLLLTLDHAPPAAVSANATPIAIGVQTLSGTALKATLWLVACMPLCTPRAVSF